jgi:putative aldouronate transport system permease protein
MVNSNFKRSTGERIFDIFNILLMIFIIVVTIFPFWLQFSISFSERKEILKSVTILFPKGFNLESYKLAFSYDTLWIGYRNTIIRSVLGIPVSLIVISLAAYPLSIPTLPHRKVFTVLILFTMLFSGGLIPEYLLVNSLGMYDTIWALVFPPAFNAFYIFVTRNFYMSLPSSLRESAVIDGASALAIFIRIIIPLSMPIIATISLFVLVDHWNAWFDAVIYITDRNLQVLQAVLRRIVIVNDISDMKAMMSAMGQRGRFTGRQLQATVIMLSVLPMLITYPFIQKYFVKGIMIGAIKG